MCDSDSLHHVYEFADRAADTVRRQYGHDNLIAITVDEVETDSEGGSLFYYITFKARWSDGRRESLLIVYPADYFREQSEDYLLQRAINKLRRQLVMEDLDKFDAGVKLDKDDAE